MISFLIPARNEAATIREVLERIDALGLKREVIVVDDGSSDGTAAIVEEYAERSYEVQVVSTAPRGKGAAIRKAIPRLTGDIAVIQDADMEYDPADVPALIDPILRGKADVVYGSRLTGGRPQRAYLFWHLVGNRLLSLVAGALYNTTLTDIETGYKAFRTPVLTALELREDGFGIEAEITGQVCRGGLRIYEVPVSYFGRTYAEGKGVTWRDGLEALWVLMRVRFRKLRSPTYHAREGA
jgi:glycosyltransferase involved in cell wall biosynthesis